MDVWILNVFEPLQTGVISIDSMILIGCITHAVLEWIYFNSLPTDGIEYEVPFNLPPTNMQCVIGHWLDMDASS